MRAPGEREAQESAGETRSRWAFHDSQRAPATAGTSAAAAPPRPCRRRARARAAPASHGLAQCRCPRANRPVAPPRIPWCTYAGHGISPPRSTNRMAIRSAPTAPLRSRPSAGRADASTPWIRPAPARVDFEIVVGRWCVSPGDGGRPCGVALPRAWPAALRPAAGRRGPRTRSMALSTAMEMVWVRKVDLNHSAVRSQDVNARGGRGVTAFLLEVRPVRQHLAVEGGPWKFKASPCAGAIASHVIRSLQECMT